MLKAFTYDILEDRPYDDVVASNVIKSNDSHKPIPSNINHPHQEGNTKRSEPQRSNPFSGNTHNNGRSRSPYGGTH